MKHQERIAEAEQQVQVARDMVRHREEEAKDRERSCREITAGRYTDCPACSGSGEQSVYVGAYLPGDSEYTVHVCQTCGGRGYLLNRPSSLAK